ncbi:MAG: hypothetical protein ACPIA5_05395, partial [Flavobacteriales bacterium]
MPRSCDAGRLWRRVVVPASCHALTHADETMWLVSQNLGHVRCPVRLSQQFNASGLGSMDRVRPRRR